MSTLRPKIELTHAAATACADELRRVCERLSSVIDLSPLFGNLTAEAVIVAAVTGAPPAKCVSRVPALLAGGLPGLRAFCHLATEAAGIQVLGFDPFLTTSPLERVLPLAGKSFEEQVLLRHEVLFTRPETQGVWARAHLEAVQAEQGLVRQLVQARLERPPDRGVLFWFDPGLSDDEINVNADVSLRLGVPVPPRSAAPRQAFHDAYASLFALARG